MADNNRNQDQDSKSSVRQNQNDSPANQSQNISDQQQPDQNSQRGSKWSNYQTRELSDDGYSDEGISDKESA